METVNAARLRSITLDDWQPVQLEVEGERLVLEDCLRLLPGRRIAAKARYRGMTVFAKVMFGPGHQKLAEREMAILQQLQAGDVLVPRPLSLRHGEGLTVMLTEWLGGAEPIVDSIRNGNEQVLDALLKQIDHVYQSGFYQRDLHLDNFVWLQGRLRVLDAGAMVRLPAGRLRRKRLQIRNLALLCAQASLDCADLLRERIERHFEFAERRRLQLGRALKRARNRRIRHARRKWLRSCSAVRRIHLNNGIALLDRAQEAYWPELSALLREPASMPAIKRGSRIHVHANLTWVIKHYRDSSLRARMKCWLGLDSARRSWTMGWTLSMLGVPTPRPVAWLRLPTGGSILVYSRLEGPPLSDLMEQQPERAQTLFPKVVVWLERMGQAGCWHGDTKAQNVLIVDELPWFIDLDASGWSRFSAMSTLKNRRDRKRFYANYGQFKPRGDRA